MNKIRNIIIILILIIIVIITSIILLYFRQNKEEIVGDIEGDIGETVEITQQTQNVYDIGKFKTVEVCIQKYYNILNDRSEEFYKRNDEGEYQIAVNETGIRKMRLDFLSKEYIDKNQINTNNIYEYVKTKNELCTVIALKMKTIIDIPVEKYIVQAIVINYNNEILEEMYTIVNLDTENGTFSIEPISDDYNNIDEIKISNNNDSIESNNNNKYTRIDSYNYAQMAENYFLTYKKLALAKPEVLYDYMDNVYRDKRWGSKENFIEYINENKSEIRKLKFEEYLVNNEDNITQFVCRDQYENLYIFNETVPMQFELKLDTYTITTDNFKQTYQNVNDERKVQLNIDKFIKMINACDYRNIYNCIDDGFKNNYFKTEQELEEYIKSRFFRYNKVIYRDIEKKGTDIFVASLQITDFTEESDELKDINVVIQLIDENTFNMSFEVQ